LHTQRPLDAAFPPWLYRGVDKTVGDAITPAQGFGLVLLLLVLLKTIAIVLGMRWMIRCGKRHVDRLRRLPAPKREDFFASFAEGGNFFPFGVKDFRLRRWIDDATSCRRALGVSLQLLHSGLFTYPALVLIAPTYLVGATLSTGVERSPWPVVLYALTLLTLAMSMAILAEQVIGFLILGDFTKYVQMLGTDRNPGGEFVDAFKVLACPIIGIVATGTAAVFSTTQLLQGFEMPQGTTWEHLNTFDQLAYSLYFTTTTLSTTGYGDVHPQNSYGIFIAIALQTCAFMVLTFVVALFLSSRDWRAKGADPRAGE
jgi:hypothetical protein